MASFPPATPPTPGVPGLAPRRARFGATWIEVPPWHVARGRRPSLGDPGTGLSAEATWRSILDTVLYECDPATGDPVFTVFTERVVPVWRGGKATRLIFQWTLGARDQCGLWQVARKAIRVRSVWVPRHSVWLPQIALIGSSFIPLPCPWWRPEAQGRTIPTQLAGPLDPAVRDRFAHPDPQRRVAAMADATPAIWL